MEKEKQLRQRNTRRDLHCSYDGEAILSCSRVRCVILLYLVHAVHRVTYVPCLMFVSSIRKQNVSKLIQMPSDNPNPLWV